MTERRSRRARRSSQLDSAALEESINQQRIATEKARAAKIQAEKDYAAAKLAVEEYLQGTFVQSVQDQDAQITIAEENLRSAQNALEHSQRMFRKGYISALDLESQKFQVQRAQLELESAQHRQRRAGQVHQVEDDAGTGKQTRLGGSQNAIGGRLV